MANITSVKGFRDILPEETEKWQFVENTARKIFSNFGVREIRIPILEKTELFKRGIGEATDIVEKEMYTFLDRGDEYLTLRPEATAGVMRSYLQHHMYAADPIAKLFTIGPMFRRERPQKGRFRQFNQINVEFIGQKDPRADAELIYMLIYFLHAVGLHELSLQINSLGCPQCRPSFRNNIVAFLENKESDLCPDCQRRLLTNPLRVFDCKVESCQEALTDAPVILDYICSECNDHFEAVKKNLVALGASYTLNPRMVRGLDYYTNTAFEIIAQSLGAQNAVAGGGRYDGLIELLGGPAIPGIGFAIGFDRLISLIPGNNDQFYRNPDLFIAALGPEAQELAFSICNTLRIAGIMTEMDLSGKSLKSQMKRSNKLNSTYTLIIGQKELDEKTAPLRNMKEGTQADISLDSPDDIIKYIKADTNNI